MISEQKWKCPRAAQWVGGWESLSVRFKWTSSSSWLEGSTEAAPLCLSLLHNPDTDWQLWNPILPLNKELLTGFWPAPTSLAWSLHLLCLQSSLVVKWEFEFVQILLLPLTPRSLCYQSVEYFYRALSGRLDGDSTCPKATHMDS